MVHCGIVPDMHVHIHLLVCYKVDHNQLHYYFAPFQHNRCRDKAWRICVDRKTCPFYMVFRTITLLDRKEHFCAAKGRQFFLVTYQIVTCVQYVISFYLVSSETPLLRQYSTWRTIWFTMAIMPNRMITSVLTETWSFTRRWSRSASNWRINHLFSALAIQLVKGNVRTASAIPLVTRFFAPLTVDN